ncbi:MAG: DUF705 domain-containing protein [Ahniella sp.]|nr:DUF705 domain-containing protein [Ahniella sp.]
MKQRVVYIDVDDTLIRSFGTKRMPMASVVASVRALHEQGVALYLWSSGGGDYARESAAELGIETLFIAFLPKPDVYIDDQSFDEWRLCRHVPTGQCG